MNIFNSSELVILDFIQEHFRCAFLDVLLPFITMLGDAGIIWIVAAVVMLFFKQTRKTGLTMGVALIIGLALGNGVLKNVVGRIRPYDVNTEVQLLVERLSDKSFPSGHTLASFEAAGVLMICDRRRFGYAALALAIVIAFSRLYLYVHYPTDVLAGIILGLLFAFLAYLIVNALYKKFKWDREELKTDNI